LPLLGFGDSLQDGISLTQQALHVPAKHKDLHQAPKDRQWRGEAKHVFHLRQIGRQRPENMIVLHGVEGALNHGVLKVHGSIHRGDLARQTLPDGKVLRPPGHTLAEIDQAGAAAALNNRRLAPMNISGEVRLDAASQIEAAPDRCTDQSTFFERVQI